MTGLDALIWWSELQRPDRLWTDHWYYLRLPIHVNHPCRGNRSW